MVVVVVVVVGLDPGGLDPAGPLKIERFQGHGARSNGFKDTVQKV